MPRSRLTADEPDTGPPTRNKVMASLGHHVARLCGDKTDLPTHTHTHTKRTNISPIPKSKQSLEKRPTIASKAMNNLSVGESGFSGSSSSTCPWMSLCATQHISLNTTKKKSHSLLSAHTHSDHFTVITSTPHVEEGSLA
jgi:hypothetical protein